MRNRGVGKVANDRYKLRTVVIDISFYLAAILYKIYLLSAYSSQPYAGVNFIPPVWDYEFGYWNENWRVNNMFNQSCFYSTGACW
jgi:hypothetical protein